MLKLQTVQVLFLLRRAINIFRTEVIQVSYKSQLQVVTFCRSQQDSYESQQSSYKSDGEQLQHGPYRTSTCQSRSRSGT